jgi:hypothetical protein
MATEVLAMATGNSEDLKAFMSLVARGDDVKIMDMEDHISRLSSSLKEKESEADSLKARLQIDQQRLRAAFDQMTELEVLFRDAIKAADARKAEVKSEVSIKNVEILRQSSELFVCAQEIDRLKTDEEVHKTVEDNLLTEIKALKSTIAELEEKKYIFEELEATITSMEEERTATIEELKDVHTANTQLQEKYDRLVDELDYLVANKALFRPAATESHRADDERGETTISSPGNKQRPACKLYVVFIFLVALKVHEEMHCSISGTRDMLQARFGDKGIGSKKKAAAKNELKALRSLQAEIEALKKNEAVFLEKQKSSTSQMTELQTEIIILKKRLHNMEKDKEDERVTDSLVESLKAENMSLEATIEGQQELINKLTNECTPFVTERVYKSVQDKSVQVEQNLSSSCVQTEAVHRIDVDTDVEGLSNICLQIENRDTLIALQGLLKEIKGLSRKHIPFRSFVDLGTIDNVVQGPRKALSGARIERPSSRSRSVSPNKQGELRSDIDNEMEMKPLSGVTKNYLKEGRNIYRRLRNEIQEVSGKTNGLNAATIFSTKVAINCIGTIFQTTLHLLNPRGKDTATAYPELLAALLNEEDEIYFDDSDDEESVLGEDKTKRTTEYSGLGEEKDQAKDNAGHAISVESKAVEPIGKIDLQIFLTDASHAEKVTAARGIIQGWNRARSKEGYRSSGFNREV